MPLPRVLVAATLLVVCCSGDRQQQQQQQSGGFRLGRRQADDEVIEQREEVARGSPDCALSYVRTYVASNEHLVTRLDVDDLGQGATAALVAGGPAHTFVSLSFAVARHGRMRFNVTLYGKLPPYRKVVR
ncbi:uncharacterized protein LOC131667190 [Phymastichus coffea]|uniref:uncharacterized protein LOC131667190 n=1 Tax=Phymastichus coffea TaxID=108790 RepID=UPI00273AFF19|nr:uncharacterized protein LOC131667190 [Phymastichus coffea]